MYFGYLGIFMTMFILNSMRNFQKKSAERIKMRISCKVLFSLKCVVYEIIMKKVAGRLSQAIDDVNVIGRKIND